MLNSSLRLDFASDNVAGIAPEALSAIGQFATGFVSSYGTDEVTARAADLIRNCLDADCEVFFLSSGTAANALAAAVLCPPHDALLAHRYSHLLLEEAGAPGFMSGGALVTGLDGAHGRIDLAALERALDIPESAHRQVPSVLSFANPTEMGTCYTAEAVRALTEPARRGGLRVHWDGARLANLAAAGFDLKTLPSLGIDVLVMGGTKAGMWGSEAIVLFDRSLGRRFSARLKQAGQLPSKSRFLAAPWIGMLESGAYVSRAAHANRMAAKLARDIPFEIAHPVETNAVFVRLDLDRHRRLEERGWRVFRLADGAVRFMCSWATTEEQVEELVSLLAEVA